MKILYPCRGHPVGARVVLSPSHCFSERGGPRKTPFPLSARRLRRRERKKKPLGTAQTPADTQCFRPTIREAKPPYTLPNGSGREDCVARLASLFPRNPTKNLPA